MLRIAPGFLPGSCSFLFNRNDWGAGAEGDTAGSGPPPVTASEALSRDSCSLPPPPPMMPGASREKWLSCSHGAHS